MSEHDIIVTIVLAALGSSGLWTFISMIGQHYLSIYDKKHGEQSAEARMLRGLGHDRIVYECNKYLQRGYITSDEYDDLNVYLFEPYRALKGNGTAEKLMSEVERLPSTVPPRK